MRTSPRAAPLLLLAVVLGAPAPAHAQSAGPAPSPLLAEADSLLQVCAAAAQRRDEKAAKAAAARAAALYRRELGAHPADPAPRVGAARVISQCRMRFANFMVAGRLIGESNRLLAEALQLDALHWVARYTLALNHYHTPEFLGRTDDAIRHFEILLQQQGERPSFPQAAGTYLYLGNLYLRAGRRAEAVALWERGAALFPEHVGLRERMQEESARAGSRAGTPHGSADGGGEPPTPGLAGPAVGPAVPRAALERLTVRARRMAAQETLPGALLGRLDVLTAPGGTGDLLQTLRMQGIVTQAGDGSDLYVRGGDPAEAPVWIDGGRMFYPGTFESLHGGLFGALDPAVLREAYFSGGGFSARYGNALSGVLDVQTDGRPGAPGARVGASLAGANASLRLPLGPRAGAWATARLTDATLLVHMQGVGDEFTQSPRALQTVLGASAQPRLGLELKATALLEGDASTRHVASYGYDGPFASRGRTQHAVLSARAAHGDAASARAVLAFSERRTGFRFGVLDRERSDRGVSLALRGDLPLPVGALRAGAEATWLAAHEEGTMPETNVLTPGSPTFVVDERSGTRHLGGFVEAEFELAPALSLVSGLRTDRLPGEATTTFDPRLALAYRAAGWTLRLGGGVFQQGRWRVRYELPNAGAPSGTPRRARHLALGAERDGTLPLRLEAYVKEYDRYVPTGDGLPIRRGRVAGGDALLRWALGERLSGWTAYSLVRGRVELEDGRRVASRLDVTHGATAVGKLALGTGWELGVTGRYATGRPYTPVVAGRVDSAGGGWQPVYGETHGARLPDYRRLDARVTRIGTVGGRNLVTYVELLNLLDRRNVMGYTYDATFRERLRIDSFFSRRVVMLGGELQLR